MVFMLWEYLSDIIVEKNWKLVKMAQEKKYIWISNYNDHLKFLLATPGIWSHSSFSSKIPIDFNAIAQLSFAENGTLPE